MKIEIDFDPVEVVKACLVALEHGNKSEAKRICRLLRKLGYQAKVKRIA